MQTMLLVSLLLLAASGALTAPAQRAQRDVSELMQPAYNYLPPEVKLALPEAATTAEIVKTEAPVTEAVATAPPPSAKLTNNGYEYRTVRRLKYRQRVRRDVSHLSTQYLPPSKTYLPPGQATMALPDDTVEVNAAMLKDAQIYLPPQAEATDADTEAPAPIEAETEVPLEAEEAETAAPAELLLMEAAEAAEADEAEEAEEAPQTSAVLAADGYHYKQPSEQTPMLGEYLPPLQEEQTVAEGPEEGAVLTADGYHYRAIRRLKF